MLALLEAWHPSLPSRRLGAVQNAPTKDGTSITGNFQSRGAEASESKLEKRRLGLRPRAKAPRLGAAAVRDKASDLLPDLL